MAEGPLKNNKLLFRKVGVRRYLLIVQSDWNVLRMHFISKVSAINSLDVDIQEAHSGKGKYNLVHVLYPI